MGQISLSLNKKLRIINVSDRMATPKIKEVRNKVDTIAFKCWDMPDGSNLPLKIKDPNAKRKELNELEYKDGDLPQNRHKLVEGLIIYGSKCEHNYQLVMLDFAPLDG